jgi:hypothetical protein
MPDARFRVRVTNDRKTVAIETAPSERPSHQVELTLDELNRLISELGDARSQMVKGQPRANLDEVMISTVASTNWCIKALPPSEALVAFDHPKFGAVGFTLPRDQIARIVRFLTDRFILQHGPSTERH